MRSESRSAVNRRQFVAAAGAGAAGLAMAVGARAQDASSASAKTWLTYAVNIEMTFNKLPVLDRLRKVAEAGFTHYEFWPWKGKDIDAMFQLNKELGLTPTQFSSFWGITHPNKKEAFLEAVRGCIAPAEKLGVKKLCVVAGEESPGLSRDEQDRAVIDALKAGGEIVKPHGITLILEPLNVLVDHPKQLVVTSEHAARILKSVDSPNVRMLFDIYHQQISEGNLSGNIRKYKDLIGYFQLADHPGRHEPGTGEINYARVLRTIHDVGYTGAIGLEMSPIGDPTAALRAIRKVDAEAKAL
jgi:hydroxypyruvate isomerase